MIFGKVRQLVRLISTHGYYSCRTEASELDTSVCLPQRSGTLPSRKAVADVFKIGVRFSGMPRGALYPQKRPFMRFATSIAGSTAPAVIEALCAGSMPPL